jgi:hypothetical protein
MFDRSTAALAIAIVAVVMAAAGITVRDIMRNYDRPKRVANTTNLVRIIPRLLAGELHRRGTVMTRSEIAQHLRRAVVVEGIVRFVDVQFDERGVLLDDWGTALRITYYFDSGGPVVSCVSFGPDRRPNTADDIHTTFDIRVCG